MTGPVEPPPENSALARARSAVMNVLVADGLGIALTGAFLRSREHGAVDLPPDLTHRWSYGTLLALIVASYATRRLLTAPSALRDPSTRAERLHRGHVASALIGALAVPLGFAFGYAVEPDLPAVAPFWVGALGLGALAWPRRRDFDAAEAP